MHDCRTLEKKLVDLVFDELNADEKLRLLAEVETCADCQSEYRSMTCSLNFSSHRSPQRLWTNP